MLLSPTRFDGLAPGLARAVLAAVAAITALLVLVALPMVDTENAPQRQGDLTTYAQVVERLRAGEPYYQALHTELVENGYGVRSIFNWRPPFFLSALAVLPSPAVAQAILVLLAALGAVLGYGLVAGAGAVIRIALGVLFPLAFLSLIAPLSAYMCELYAGILILVSVAAYARRRVWLGFAAALLALLTRELAIGYVLVCLALAIRERRRAEIAAWFVAIAAFCAYYAWHGMLAMQMVAPGDPGYADSWLQFGGIGFDLATARFNGIFLLAPHWVTALLLPLALLGLLAWPAPVAGRVVLTVFAYLVAFAIVGKPVNTYWGALYTPLLAFGLAWALPALRDLVVAARRPAPVVGRA